MGVPFNSATDLAAAIRAKELSPLEALDAYLERVDRINPTLNAFALRDDERARSDARAATERLASSPGDDLPPLFGVPVPIKDLDDVAGWPTTHGSWATSPDPIDADGPMAERLRAAGAVLMGKTTTPEFGTVSYTESDRLGITRNPWNPDHTPGGSSGGAGASVASGMAPIAQASDGGGSIRIPASCNGLVGLKAGRNRIPQQYEMMGGAITGGVVTRTVADTALALDLLAVRDTGSWNLAPAPERPFRDEVGLDAGRLRIAVCTESPVGVPVEPSVAAATERFGAVLAGLGHHVELRSPVWPDAASFLNAFVVGWGTLSAYLDLRFPDRVEPHDREPDPATSAAALTHALMVLQDATRALAAQFGRDFDLLLTPTMAVEPPEVGTWLRDVPAEMPEVAVMNCLPMATFTAIFNATGLPAISLPAEVSAAGLPIGVQLVSGPWQEATLLRVAAAAESVVRWDQRWPEIAGV